MLKDLSFILCVGFSFSGVGTVVAQTRTYTTTQISTGAVNHESPSINNNGDVVWSQQVGGFWQVYLLPSGSTVPGPLPGQASDHNNQYPDIDNAGDVVYLKDNVGQGAALAVILNHGGTESTIQFSSINVLSGQQRIAGKHSGIAGNGTTITYFDFPTFGSGPRTFVVSGSNLSPNFTGADFPDINSNGTFVYSLFGTILSASVAAPNSSTMVASGSIPRIADVVPPATVPEIVYINGGGNVVSTVGGVVDVGSWADVNNSGKVVYEKAVSGLNQLFLANPCQVAVIPSPTPLGIPDPQSYVVATFVAPNSAVPPYPATTVLEYAKACGFDHFNWQNKITYNSAAPAGSTIEPRFPGPLIASANVAYFGTLVSPQDNHCMSDWIGCSLIAPPTYFDPPSGSYTYTTLFYNPYPYYIPTDLVTTPGSCPVDLRYCPSPIPYALSLDGTTLSFVDAPNEYYRTDNNFVDFIAFSTALVGVDSLGNAHSLGFDASFTWKSTFNGTAGGVHQTALAYPTDPGSGTGGVTITGINGVTLPPVVPTNQVTTTASGLA